MNHHLSDNQLIGYIHQTLTDAEREEIDRHLVECARCRGHLGDQEAIQRRIRYGLMNGLRKVSPSSQMTFAAISPGPTWSSRLVTLWAKTRPPLSAVAMGAQDTEREP